MAWQSCWLAVARVLLGQVGDYVRVNLAVDRVASSDRFAKVFRLLQRRQGFELFIGEKPELACLRFVGASIRAKARAVGS